LHQIESERVGHELVIRQTGLGSVGLMPPKAQAT
jgi:hypothetical protein